MLILIYWLALFVFDEFKTLFPDLDPHVNPFGHAFDLYLTLFPEPVLTEPQYPSEPADDHVWCFSLVANNHIYFLVLTQNIQWLDFGYFHEVVEWDFLLRGFRYTPTRQRQVASHIEH